MLFCMIVLILGHYLYHKALLTAKGLHVFEHRLRTWGIALTLSSHRSKWLINTSTPHFLKTFSETQAAHLYFIKMVYQKHSNYFLCLHPIDIPSCQMGHVAACDLTHSCTTEHARIASVGYPNSYYQRSTCTWSILTQPGTFILLEFLTFDIPSLGKCDSSSLAIYNAQTDKYEALFGIFCNLQPPTERSRSDFNFLYLKLHAGAEEPGQGFLAEYEQRQRGNLNTSFENSKLRHNTLFKPIIICYICFIKTLSLKISLKIEYHCEIHNDKNKVSRWKGLVMMAWQMSVSKSMSVTVINDMNEISDSSLFELLFFDIYFEFGSDFQLNSSKISSVLLGLEDMLEERGWTEGLQMM